MEAFFLPLGAGRRFALLHRPPAGQRSYGTVLHVHPFAEEMNKSRRAAALAARALATSGWTVLQIDLDGCGDSTGDFGDATWDGWVADVLASAEWLRRGFDGRHWLWGVRAGALLCAAAVNLPPPMGLLLWQPVHSGRQHLNQFLRLKLANEMIGATARTGTQALRAQLERGEHVEVAGYRLGPALAEGLARAELDLPRIYDRAVWLEVSSAAEPALAPGSRSHLAKARERGVAVEAACVQGEPFWQTQEISECQPLVDATVAILSAARQ